MATESVVIEPSPAAAPFPPLVEVLDRALALLGASFVVYRRRTLIEFKTEGLRERVSRYVEEGHVSWQIGAFDDHHCHLDLDGIVRVVFGAEPVSCQKGRLNWTVWFEIDGDAGNPYRPAASCSVTLNKPYDPRGERKRDEVDAVYALYDRVRDVAGVTAETEFLAARVAAP